MTFFSNSFFQHSDLTNFVPSGSVGSSLYPKPSCKSCRGATELPKRVFNEQNLRVDANCWQTPDGRGQAGDHLKETKSEHRSGPEKDKRCPSDLEDRSVSRDSRSWVHTHSRSGRGVFLLQLRVGGWEARKRQE